MNPAQSKWFGFEGVRSSELSKRTAALKTISIVSLDDASTTVYAWGSSIREPIAARWCRTYYVQATLYTLVTMGVSSNPASTVLTDAVSS